MKVALLLLCIPALAVSPLAAAEPPPAWDTLCAAGDTVLARWQHDLVARHDDRWPLAGVAPILDAADAALCNLECCVSTSGVPAEKGERCPFYYRTRPEMLRCLTSAGIDIVAAANNHVGDYGPVGVAETLKWTGEAGLVSAGIGVDLEDAERPRLVRIGRTLVAIGGLDMTMPAFAAASGRPGSSFAAEDEALEAFAGKVRRLGAEARGRCHLILLTVHWGDNWVREVSPLHRRMARAAFAGGVDLILGHSAHRLKGMEVVDGKVVLYDMGNLFFDCSLRDEGRRSAIFRLHLSPSGVHRVDVVPIEAREGHAVPASPAEGISILEEMEALSAPLGTSLKRNRDGEGRPMGVLDVPAPAVTQRPPVGPDVSFASFPRTREFQAPRSEAPLRGQVPEGAVPVRPPAKLSPGIEFLGFRLPPAAKEGGILTIATWWRVARPIEDGRLVAFELTTAGKVLRRGSPWYNRHDPGDWSLPFRRMRSGEIVEDLFPIRLQDLPAGDYEVKVLILDPARIGAGGGLSESKVLGRVSIEPRRK
jgi:poly-gamma-glutamate capsule biosynthesis protein CapA/YwtB (metallophosphatase superfamily)